MAQDIFNRACADHRAGRIGAAAAGYRAVLKMEPDHPDALHLLGVARHQQGAHDEAVALIERAIAVRPKAAKYRSNLGLVLRALKRNDDARTAFESALAADPGYTEAYNHLGLLFFDHRRYEDAAAIFRKALLYDPSRVDARNNLGRALLRLGRTQAAVDLFHAVLAALPGHADARNNLGVGLNLLGDAAGACEAFEATLAIDPNHVDAHVNYGQQLLLAGELGRGFAEHEWRLRRPGYVRAFTAPPWQGEDLAGRTILLWAEQGLGDTLQFVRYAPLVAARGGRVILECDPLLHRLLSGMEDIAAVAARPYRDAYDLHAPLMSLPHIFGAEGDTVPAAMPYLPVPSPMALAATARRKVGLVWAGNPDHARDHERSRPLAEFAPLAQVSDVAFFALQKGDAAGQQAPSGMSVTDLGPRLGDFQDTAAALAALDLLITVDTSAAHLAGGLGRPVWLILPAVPDWRWQLGRRDSPWYPTMRLFRERDGWPALFAEIAAALREL